MSRLLSFLSNLKLTLTEWLAVMAATIIGGLVVALKIQGSRLHKAQIQVMGQQLATKEANAAADTETHRANYQQALNDFLKAGGTLLLMLSLALGAPARSDQGKPDLYPKCQAALSACAALVKAQDQQIQVLQDSVKQWQKQAEKDEPTPLQVVPWPVWVLMGGVVGFGVGRLGR